MPGTRFEEPGAGAQVAGLKEGDDHGQKEVRPHVVVRPGDEGEDLWFLNSTVVP